MLDWLFSAADTHEGKIAEELGHVYFKNRMLDRGMDWLFQNAMPTTTADYQDATNNDTPFITAAPTLAGQQVIQEINENLLASRPIRDSIHGVLPQTNGRGIFGLGIQEGAENVISNLRRFGVGRFRW